MFTLPMSFKTFSFSLKISLGLRFSCETFFAIYLEITYLIHVSIFRVFDRRWRKKIKKKDKKGKTKVSTDSIQRYWWWKNLDEKHTSHTQIRVAVLDITCPWWLTPHTKKNINWFFPVILLIKESCNLIGWEAHHIQPEKEVPDASFSWWLTPCQKN